mgnify:FL=1|tara:strand:+ start:175 stop:465 length:291 start_codon:yes stop_codon:yes gene_type:complete
MACDKITAILRIAKDAGSTTKVSVHGDTVIWHDSNPLGITEEQIAAKQAVLTVEQDRNLNRQKEYGNWQSQLDEIFHNIDDWKTRVQAIKDKYPKE